MIGSYGDHAELLPKSIRELTVLCGSKLSSGVGSVHQAILIYVSHWSLAFLGLRYVQAPQQFVIDLLINCLRHPFRPNLTHTEVANGGLGRARLLPNRRQCEQVRTRNLVHPVTEARTIRSDLRAS